ncbi:MAG: hypothetical protein V4755_15610 [Curtobacterium sp.]
MSTTPPHDPHGRAGRPDDGDERDIPQEPDSQRERPSDDTQQAGWGQPRTDPAQPGAPQPWQGGQPQQPWQGGQPQQPWQGGQPQQPTPQPWQGGPPSGEYLPRGPVPGASAPPTRRSRGTAVWVSAVAVLVVALVAVGLRFAFATSDRTAAEGQLTPTSTADPSEDASAAPTQPSAPADAGAGSGSGSGSGATAAEVQREVDSMLREYPLPARVDSITQLTDIEARGTTIFYQYTIAASVDSASMSETTARRTITNTACTNDGFRAIIDDGVTLQYQYRFASDQHTFDFDVTAADC